MDVIHTNKPDNSNFLLVVQYAVCPVHF